METSAKRKGNKFERWVVSELSDIPHLEVRRQPGSGIYRDFPHDIWLRHLTQELEWTVECKHWEKGWRTGDKARGKADLLLIKRDSGEPCAYMPLSVLKDLLWRI